MAPGRAGGDLLLAYVNRERTHEVLAVAEDDGDEVVWSVTERPAASTDPLEIVLDERRTPREGLPRLIHDLEERLAATDEFFRVDAEGGHLVPLAPPPAALDMRAHAEPIPDAPDAYLEYFHFHNPEGESRMLLAMPRDPTKPAEDRFVLARYDFAASHPRDGRLAIVHPRLAPPLVVSKVAGEHIVLPRVGYRKLFEPEDYREALGQDWRNVARRVFDAATSALRVPFRERPKPEAPERHAPSPIEDVQRALLSPAYRVARAELLGEGRAEDVLRDGALGVARFVKLARREAPHEDQIRISLLEAGLLVEYGLRAKRDGLLAEHGPRLVRLARDLSTAA